MGRLGDRLICSASWEMFGYDNDYYVIQSADEDVRKWALDFTVVISSKTTAMDTNQEFLCKTGNGFDPLCCELHGSVILWIQRLKCGKMSD